MLPRRESERRAHHLSRHCDILQAIETRISMLNMTYMKYIESNLMCFIPGKVLDEMIKVLNMVESNDKPPRTHETLQELRDLSSMAMEHFDEHILPRVKEQKEQLSERNQPATLSSFGLASTSSFKQYRPLFVQQANDIQKIKKQYKVYKHTIVNINDNTQKLLQKLQKQNNRLKAQRLKIREQERKIQEQAVKIQEQETAIADIKKHMDEWDQKYKDLTEELIRTRDDLFTKTPTATNPSVITSSSSPPSKLFKNTIIKPRKAQILRKNYHFNLDLERKRKSNLLPEIPVKISRNRCVPEENVVNKLIVPITKDSEIIEPPDTKSNLSFLINSFIKTPLSTIKSRKRKIPEDIDLK